MKQAGYQAEIDQAAAIASQAGPLSEAKSRQQVVVEETSVAELEAQREEQRLQATVRKPADAQAYQQTTLAKADRDARISAAEAAAKEVELNAAADANRVKVSAGADAERVRVQAAADAEHVKLQADAQAQSTRQVGQAEADATQAKGMAEGEAVRAKGMAEAEAIKARADALAENQDAVIGQQLAEQWPAIVEAAAKPFASVDQMIVLNGAEGLSQALASALSSGVTGLQLARTLLAGGSKGNGTPTPRSPRPSRTPPRPSPPSAPATPDPTLAASPAHRVLGTDMCARATYPSPELEGWGSRKIVVRCFGWSAHDGSVGPSSARSPAHPTGSSWPWGSRASSGGSSARPTSPHSPSCGACSWPTHWSRGAHWLLLIGVGGVIAVLLRLLGDAGDTELLVDNIHVSGGADRLGPLRSLVPVSLLGIAVGGGIGPEAPLTQTTGTIGSYTGTRFGLTAEQRRICSITGMAAGFTVLFAAPLGGAVFALEILHRKGLEYYEALVPAAIGSVAGYGVYTAATGWGLQPIWHFPAPPLHLTMADLGWAAVCGVAGALVAAIFTATTLLARAAFRPLPPWARPVVAGALLGAVAFISPFGLTFAEFQLGGFAAPPPRCRGDAAAGGARPPAERHHHHGGRVEGRLHHPAVLHGLLPRPRRLGLAAGRRRAGAGHGHDGRLQRGRDQDAAGLDAGGGRHGRHAPAPHDADRRAREPAADVGGRPAREPAVART